MAGGPDLAPGGVAAGPLAAGLVCAGCAAGVVAEGVACRPVTLGREAVRGALGEPTLADSVWMRCCYTALCTSSAWTFSWIRASLLMAATLIPRSAATLEAGATMTIP